MPRGGADTVLRAVHRHIFPRDFRKCAGLLRGLLQQGHADSYKPFHHKFGTVGHTVVSCNSVYSFVHLHGKMDFWKIRLSFGSLRTGNQRVCINFNPDSNCYRQILCHTPSTQKEDETFYLPVDAHEHMVSGNASDSSLWNLHAIENRFQQRSM